MVSTYNDIKGKYVLITGANRGIGKEILTAFASNKANIYACARKKSEEFILLIQQLSQKYSVKIMPIFFDLSNEDSIKDGLKPLLLNKQPVDILINNAGIAHGGLLQMTKISQIREVFEINFFAQMHIVQIVSKIMIKHKRGSIVNIASIAGIDGEAGNCAYGASKAALIFATKAISKELAPYNIRLNAIAPGLCDTSMADMMEFKARENMINESSLKRLGNPQEIANVVLFLASEVASFINGQVLRVDGGI